MSIFLTSVDILDTGFLTCNKVSGSRSNQIGTANRANSGSALRLKGVEFTIDTSANIDKSPNPGYYLAQKHSIISLNPDEITIRIFVNKDTNDDTGAFGINDVNYLYALSQLPKTRGFKAVYYPVTDAATGDTRDRAIQPTYLYGSADTTQSQGDIDITLWTGAASSSGHDLTDIKYIPIRFESCRTVYNSAKAVIIELKGVITD